MLGLYDELVPRHTRRFAHLADAAVAALDEFAAQVRDRSFPTAAQTASMAPEVLQEALADVPGVVRSAPAGQATPPARGMP